MYVSPAAVTVPLRGDDPVFAVMAMVTDPDPVADAAEAMVNQLALLVAVHPQDVDDAVTRTTAVEAVEETLALVGVNEYVQDAAAAACVTVKVCPPMVSAPVRAADVALAPAVNDTAPLPVPDAVLTVSHAVALLTAVQAHGDVVVIVTELVTPAAGAARLEEDNA